MQETTLPVFSLKRDIINFNSPKARAQANRNIKLMTPCLNHSTSSIYRRVLARIAIAYIGSLYTITYTSAEMAQLTRECLERLNNTKSYPDAIICERRFAGLKSYAMVLRDHHKRRASSYASP